MISTVEERADELKRLCLDYGVQWLDLFVSASTGRHAPDESDLDFAVEFQPAALDAYANAYFGRPVDLVVESAIRNLYFLQSVQQTRTSIYEARGSVECLRHPACRQPAERVHRRQDVCGLRKRHLAEVSRGTPIRDHRRGDSPACPDR